MNQITEPDSAQNDIIPPSVTLGQRLREAREGLGLSRDDVARELRLHEKLIAALEAGDRSQLPPDTFVSGYLRAYARLLGLPADQLISEYFAEPITTALYRATDRTGVKVTTSHDPKFRLISYAIVAVTVLSFAAWWANERFSLVSLEPAQETGGTEEQQNMEANLPAPMPLYQESSIEEALPVQEQPANTVSLPPGGTPAPSATAAPTAAPEALPAAQSPETAKPIPPVPTVVTESLAASVPQSTLLLEFQAASWTQVEDAQGRVLVYETVTAGRKLQLQGVAPFKMFLGYAPGVLVYYNGTLFPHADYHHGELARFRVGSSQDNRPLGR